VLERSEGGDRQVVGLRSGHSGGMRAVYFFLASGGADPSHTEELSPVAPFKNTYWWPRLLSPDETASLAVQIETVVLPFFVATPLEPGEAEKRIAVSLDALQSAEPPFTRTGLTWWRTRGPIIDLVEAEPLAEGRFANVYVAVWHADLAAGLEGPLPEGVTRVASCTVGVGGIDAEPNATLFYLGPTGTAATPLGAADLPAVILPYFATIRSVEDVRNAIRPEYRSYYAGPSE